MKVSTITLGCKVNQYETQAMLNQLLQGGFSACQTGEDADIILLNSCIITSTSDHKVKQTLHIRPVEGASARSYRINRLYASGLPLKDWLGSI